MLTYSGARNTFGTLSNNTSTSNLTFGDSMINEGIRMMLGIMPWPFLEKSTTATTVAGTQFYNIPSDVEKVISVTVNVGTYKYRPTQVSSLDEWDLVNSPTGVQSGNPSYYFIFNGQIGIWPIPSSNGNTITINYQRIVRDLSVADNTTGTIVSIANGGTAVVGSGTSFTTLMAGKYIRITHNGSANTGDGLWYPIASVASSTSLTLGLPYLGTSISAGSAAFTIGDCMIIPERYQMGPVYYATAEYYRKNDEESKADRYEQKYMTLTHQMEADAGIKTTDTVIDPGFNERTIINPNLNPTIT